MKFFPIIVLLLPFAVLDGLKALTLPQVGPDKGLNTTLVANFTGLYERRNPCNNEKLESSSYAATHEYHHHTKGESWSDYTQKCSAIITNFLKSISNLIGCNHKDDGTFTFHVNTTISQKQDCKNEKCSLPTIIIEATNCLDENTEDTQKQDIGCPDEGFGQTSTETITEDSDSTGVTPLTIFDTTAETDNSFNQRNTEVGQEWNYATEQPSVTSDAFASQTLDSDQYRGQDIRPTFETETDVSSFSQSSSSASAGVDFTSSVTEQPNPVFSRPPQSPSFFLSTISPPPETTDEIDDYDTDSVNVGNTPQLPVFTNPTVQPLQPAESLDYLENQSDYVSTSDKDSFTTNSFLTSDGGFRAQRFPETTPQPSFDYPLNDASSYSRDDAASREEQSDFYQNDQVYSTYPPTEPLDKPSSIPFVDATSQTDKEVRDDSITYTSQVPESYRVPNPTIQVPGSLVRSSQVGVTGGSSDESSSETVDNNQSFSEDSVNPIQLDERTTPPQEYFPTTTANIDSEVEEGQLTTAPLTTQAQVSSFAEESSEYNQQATQSRTDLYPFQTPNYGAVTPPQDDLSESSDYDVYETTPTTPLPAFPTTQQPYSGYYGTPIDRSPGGDNTENLSLTDSQDDFTTPNSQPTSGSTSYQQSTTSTGIYESQTEPVESVQSNLQDNLTSQSFTPNPDYITDENVDSYSTQESQSLDNENIPPADSVVPLSTTSTSQNRFSESTITSSSESTQQTSLPYQTAPLFRFPQPLGPTNTPVDSNEQFGETITESSNVYPQQTSPPPSASQVVSTVNAPLEEYQQERNPADDVYAPQPQPQPSIDYSSGQLSSDERESNTVSQVQTSTTFESSDFQPTFSPPPSASSKAFTAQTYDNRAEMIPRGNVKSADTTQLSDDYYDDRVTLTTPLPLAAPRLETNPRNYETVPVPKNFAQDVPTAPRPWSVNYDEIADQPSPYPSGNNRQDFADRRVAVSQQSESEMREPVSVNQGSTGLLQTDALSRQIQQPNYPQNFALTASTARPIHTTTTVDEEVITTDSPKSPPGYSQTNNEQVDGQRRYFPAPPRPFYNGPAYYPPQQQFGNYYPVNFNPQPPRPGLNLARDQFPNYQPQFGRGDVFPGQPSGDIPYISPARPDTFQQHFFDGQYRQGRDFNGQVLPPPYVPGPFYPDWNNQQSFRRDMYDRVRSDQIQYNQMMASRNQPPFLNNPNQQVENRYQEPFNLPGNRTQVQVQNINVDQASPEVMADYNEAVTELPPGEKMVKFDEEVITLSPDASRRREKTLRSDASASSQVVTAREAFPYPRQSQQQRAPASSSFQRQSNDYFENSSQSDSYALGPDRIAPARQPGRKDARTA